MTVPTKRIIAMRVMPADLKCLDAFFKTFLKDTVRREVKRFFMREIFRTGFSELCCEYISIASYGTKSLMD